MESTRCTEKKKSGLFSFYKLSQLQADQSSGKRNLSQEKSFINISCNSQYPALSPSFPLLPLGFERSSIILFCNGRLWSLDVWLQPKWVSLHCSQISSIMLSSGINSSNATSSSTTKFSSSVFILASFLLSSAESVELYDLVSCKDL